MTKLPPLLAVLTLLAPAVLAPAAPANYPDPPQVLYQDLFVAVQEGALYQDEKAFADATPTSAPARVLRQYHELHQDKPDALKEFVAAHFTLPAAVAPPASAPEQVPILQHIDTLWDQLTRSATRAAPYSSLLSLPHPYVVPGGR